jgi:acyl carrier protein
MRNKEKYDRAFIESFSINANKLNEKLEYNSIETWDSIGHMQMIAELEDTFEIELEMDDIINFSSYNKGMEILAKYGIEVN